MEACLDEELPPTTELEEGLRNGVYLAKLGNFFAPKTVSLKKIYDREQTRYKATGLHFRHTDNVIQWLNAMSEKGLPKIFYPETTDIYDRKNMPRCIYCIHALSLYLFKLGLAPQIQDLYGKVAFTEEEIDNMKSELEKYGIQMPAFSKIGGILANELSVDEAALHAAVIAINEAIDHGVPEGTVAAMQNPNAMLVHLDPASAHQYHDTLYQAKGQKVASSRKRAEIQGNVNQVNVSRALMAAEQALLSGDEDKLYEALKAVGVQNLQLQNKGWYLKQLQEDRENKDQASPGEALTRDELQGGVDVANEVAEGFLKSTHIHGLPPTPRLQPLLGLTLLLKAVERINGAVRAGVPETTVEELMNPDAQLPEGSLSHPELLVAVEMLSSVVLMNQAMDAGDRAALWRQLSSNVTGLSNVEEDYAQRYMDALMLLKAAAREEGGDFLTWNDIQACVDQVNLAVQEEHELQVLVLVLVLVLVQVQILNKRIAAIGLINEALDEGDPAKTLSMLQNPSAKLSDVDPTVAQHYHDKLLEARREKAHINQVVKIQAFIRANKARDDYKTLISAEDPPMAVVRKFVHLLDHSDQDFQEELELMRLREEVVTNIRSNQQLENDLNLMDIKIGLLVKNKITLQEVVSHSKKLTKKNKGHLSNMMMMNKQRGGLKALSKEKRLKLEAYQYLFYLLQTNPTYLAKLIFQMPQNKSTKFMDSVIFTLYNYASNQREEYLLTKLFKTALQEEIKSKVDQMKDIVTGNPTIIKMVVSFHRGARGQNALRQILAPVVKEIMDDKTLNIKTDPVDIYKSWVNQMETQTGEASKLPYDVTPEQAMAHEEVRTRLEASIKNMKGITDKFLSAIIVSVDKIPYVSAGGQLTTEQRRNLGSVAKMLQHAASNKMFLGDNAHLNPINEYLSASHQKFRRFFLAACDVPSLEDKFNVDQYSDLVTVTKPVIYISIGEIINTHTLLLDHQDAIAPEHNDPIHELLEDLGEVPTVESLIGENPLPPDDPNKELMGKTEVSLTLTNKFDVPGEANVEMDARTLLLNTKRLIVDEAEYQRAMQRRAVRDAKTPEKMKQAAPALDDGLTLQGKKDKIKSNLQRLAELGKVQPENRYQDLINDIAKVRDIRNQRRYRQRRKAELVRLQQTNVALNSKTNFFNVQIDSYNQYIKACMDNLASKGKLSKKPGDNKAKKSKQVSQKYTASRLHEKGDLLQLQYEGVAVMKLFDRATINVNLLIFLLNKKFYGK
ncbi:Ras GTPase-activating-like protein IQGAP1 [Liparis tanakae]|uniref:Ras GTPase-activating-like protein IQGAP1 n=1 Tax=Liparis tanakae TaxID=230148 RepID=A0A4Z2G4J3_9TELE|nr:Ras GTPase-activating-like protein IQGAP1 [Liparis tanakae]